MKLKKRLQKKYCMSNRGAGIAAWQFLNDYEKRILPNLQIRHIHKKGFTVSDWMCFGLSEKNYKEYLSSLDYYKMHPFNEELYSRWIDDKLTLKYLTVGTEADFMPEYYFQIKEGGGYSH